MIDAKITKSVEMPFPKLMEYTVELAPQYIVLFHSPGLGVLIYTDNDRRKKEIGRYQTDWNMSVFKDFEGELVLRNKQ